MPIDTQHPALKHAATQWARCRAAIAGQDAVHGAAEVFLPRLKDQTDEDYRAYKGRALWFGASGRTHGGLLGMVFRRAPVVAAPAALLDAAQDLTLAAKGVDALARDVLSEVLAVGRIMALVEYPVVAEAPATLAQATASGLRPYVTTYAAESIRNWTVGRVGNVLQLTRVVLDECFAKDPADVYSHETEQQIRELVLEDGKYLQRIYRKTSGQGQVSWAQFGPDIVPLMSGQPLGFIPAVVFSPESLDADVAKPPLLDLVDVNLSHYRSTADLEHGAHFAGLPTAVITGYTAQDGEKLYIGSAAAWVFPAADADAKFLEFSGQGLTSLENRCTAKEQMMAALGARMLAPEKTGVEAADTLAQRHNGEASVLGAIARNVSDGVQRVLEIVAQWMGVTGEVSYALSTDYLPAGLSAQDLTALVAAWQQGAISWNTLFDNLKRGEVVDESTTADDEQGRIGTSGPTLPTPAPSPAA